MDSRPVWPARLDLCNDVAESAWILPRLLDWGRTIGTPVTSLVPRGYDAYVRVLHPASAGPEGETVRWRAIAETTGRVFHPLVQFERIFDPAALEAANGSVAPPRVGHLGLATCAALYGQLAGWTTTPEDCWFGIWDGWGSFGYPRSMVFFGPGRTGQRQVEADLEALARRLETSPRFRHPDRDYFLAHGPLGAACDLVGSVVAVTPNLAWPRDRAWVVATEIDFDSTLVACPAACAEALLANPALEAVRVGPRERLDLGGDVRNPER